MYKSNIYKGHPFPTTYWNIISYFIFSVPKKQNTGFPFWKAIKFLNKYFIFASLFIIFVPNFFSHCHRHKSMCIYTISKFVCVRMRGNSSVLFCFVRMEYGDYGSWHYGIPHEQTGKQFPPCCEFNKIFKCFKISIVKWKFLYTGQNLRLKFCYKNSKERMECLVPHYKHSQVSLGCS